MPTAETRILSGYIFNTLLFQNPNVQTKQSNLQTFVLKRNSSEGMGSNLTVLLAEHATSTKIRESYSEFTMCVFFIGLFLNVFPLGFKGHTRSARRKVFEGQLSRSMHLFRHPGFYQKSGCAAFKDEVGCLNRFAKGFHTFFSRKARVSKTNAINCVGSVLWDCFTT